MKKNLIIIAVILVLAIPAAIFLYKKSKEDTEQENDTSGTSTNKNTAGNSVFPLKRGDVKAEVKMLQQNLNRIAKTNLDDDGKFGEKTETAVYSWFKTKTVSQKQFDTLQQNSLYSIGINPVNRVFTTVNDTYNNIFKM